MLKNDVITAVVTGLGSNCEGIAKVDGIICFIPFALVGEKVTFKVLKVQNSVAYCKLLEVLTPAEERVRPLCNVFLKCGGCHLQHLNYQSQLKVKSNIIKDCFSKIANINVNVSKAVKGEQEFYYRNKIQLPIRNVNGENKIGFFAENSHRIVDIESCCIQKPFANILISIIKKFINLSNVTCYNEETCKGLLKHVVGRDVKGKLLLILVINGDNLPESDLLISLLKEHFCEFSLILNINKRNTNVILGDSYKVLFGAGFYYIDEFNIKYPVYPQSFMQVNDSVKEKLYNAVIKNILPEENTTVIDAYSGAGVLSAMLAKNAKKVIGIEIVEEAVKSANALKELNGLEGKLINICGDCKKVLPLVIESERQLSSHVSVVLDPPRKGCDKEVLFAILKELPEKIVYVACSPQSLARDVGILMNTLVWKDGQLVKNDNPNSCYEITKIIPYEMFPQTKHVETLVCLTRVNHNI